MGRSYADIKDYLRGVPIKGYIILYRINDSGIEILRVTSGYRDLESLFADSDDE
jgi:toxin ParE1/3/4